MGFDQVRLDQIAAKRPNAVAAGPFGSNLVSKDYTEFGVPVIRGQNLVGKWVAGEFVFVSQEKAEALRSNTAKPGDVIFTQRGTLGQVSLVPDKPFGIYVVSQSQMKLTVDQNQASNEFVYYACTTRDFIKQVYDNAIAAGVPHINLGLLKSFTIPLPGRGEQDEIVGVLKALDDKIALLRETNATLEAIAQAIFKSWFVDFDPVRAKAEGREPEGVPPEVADLFPSEFEDSELGAIPKGWRVVRIDDLLQLVYGKALKSTDRKAGDVPVYGSGGITGTHDQALVEVPTVIVGRKGTVGSLYWEDRPCFPIDTVFYVKPLLASLEFCFRVLQMLPLRDMNTDAAVPGLNRENVYRLKVCLPHPAILRAFEETLGTLRRRTQANRDEIEVLANLRDTLLPRLMSGKLRIPDVQEALA